MTDSLKILSARRAYEFAPDDLRLTVLSNASFLGHLQEAFNFDQAGIGHPEPTFGEVPATTPPGLVFAFGMAELGDEVAVPIRYMHFEARRIVIDVAGPSEMIEPIYDSLRSMLRDIQAPDGSPVLGVPTQILDYSEVVVQLNMAPSAMLESEVCQLFVSASGEASGTLDLLAVPRWEMHVQAASAEYGPSTVPPHRVFRLALRPGTTPKERRFYSGAPLDTTAHVKMLHKLEQLLGTGTSTRRKQLKAR